MTYRPEYLDEAKAGERSVQAGWWAVDESGAPVFGPYPTREAALIHIAEKRGADQVRS